MRGLVSRSDDGLVPRPEYGVVSLMQFVCIIGLALPDIETPVELPVRMLFTMVGEQELH